MKADRLLSALLLLQARGRLTGRELSQLLEVSERTVHRDMEALSASGVPLFALRGAQGGWQLDEHWRTEVPGLDDSELQALLMAQPSALGDPRLAAAAERAFGKLMAAMPGSMRNQAASIRARLHIDPTGWRPASEDLSMLPVVQDAIARDAKLTFLYARRDGVTAPRTVDPFGLVSKQNVWYLVARAPAGLRTYRISRMSNAVVLAVPFARPANFDLARYWKAATAQLTQERQGYTATLALTSDAVASLSYWCPVTPTPYTPPKSPIAADWVVCKVEFESLSQAHFVALGFGRKARVLAPPALRERVLADARAVASS